MNFRKTKANEWVSPSYQLTGFHDGGRYHIETSPLICSTNQWTGFYMITTSVMKELKGILCNSGTEKRLQVLKEWRK